MKECRLKLSILFLLILIYSSSYGQFGDSKEKKGFRLLGLKVTKRSYGMIAGIQRGKYTFLELGAEHHWKKVRLTKARLWAASANMEYNFGNNILGYKASFWGKRGRVNLTYGLNAAYYTDFDRHKFGGGPVIGFRLLGFHLTNGYNFLFGSKDFKTYNNIYVSLRYYFPLDKKTKIEKKE